MYIHYECKLFNPNSRFITNKARNEVFICTELSIRIFILKHVHNNSGKELSQASCSFECQKNVRRSKEMAAGVKLESATELFGS